MARAVTFHELHGPNVVLGSGNTDATWQLERSGGVLFSEDPLRPGDNVKVTCEGSGRVRVGCTTGDPLRYKVDVPDSVGEIEDFEVMNEIRFHKRECSVHVFLNTTGDTITSSCGFLKYDKVVHRKQPVWIAMYIMFGEVKITTTKHDETRLKLSLSHGVNVKLDETRTEATSICQSPGALCVTRYPLFRGESVYLRCQPTVDQGHAASNFYLKLLISNKRPDTISDKRDGFTLTDICTAKSPLTDVETLRKDECNGEVRVSLLQDNRLEYRTANNKVNSQTLWYEPTGGVWIYLELYRIRASIDSHKSNLGRQLSEPYEIMSGGITGSLPRQRTLSTRSNVSYQYTHVTCGSRGRTAPLSPQPRCSINRSGSYIDMGHAHLSSSCPANLNQGGTDDVDGICNSLEDLSTHVKTLNERVETLTQVFVAGASPTRETNSPSYGEHAELRLNIQHNWTELINCLQTEAMGDLLFQHGVLTHPELDKIRRVLKHDGQEANRLVMDILIKRGISKTLLNDILEKAGDTHLKTLFFKQ